MHYLYTMDSFKDYVEKEIIPRYASFDAAHREDHVRSVIEKSQKLARFYDVKKSNSQHKRQKTTGHPEKTLRELIKDEPRLHQLFDAIYDEVTS